MLPEASASAVIHSPIGTAASSATSAIFMRQTNNTSPAAPQSIKQDCATIAVGTCTNIMR